MIPKDTLRELQDDCVILLNRAWLGKTVSAFGADGHGDYGQSPFAKYFTIDDITLLISENKITGEITGTALLNLTGFDSSIDGHCATDKNLTISLNKLLADQHIDPTCWKYESYEFQGMDFVVVSIDVSRLLDWP